MREPYGAYICHSTAHLNIDENNAPQLFTGAKAVTVSGMAGKITPAILQETLDTWPDDYPHNPPPMAFSMTQLTELGTVYAPEETKALTDVIKAYKVPVKGHETIHVHEDGSRFANSLVTLNYKPEDITWRTGIDILSLGGTKNGAMGVEAVVFFRDIKEHAFPFHRKCSGHTLSKSRFLAAQMIGLLSNNHWLENARHANQMARKLAGVIASLDGVRLPWEPQGNLVFAAFPRSLHKKLQAAGATYYEWPYKNGPEGPFPSGFEIDKKNEVFVRLVTAWDTEDEEIDQFETAARAPEPV